MYVSTSVSILDEIEKIFYGGLICWKYSNIVVIVKLQINVRKNLTLHGYVGARQNVNLDCRPRRVKYKPSWTVELPYVCITWPTNFFIPHWTLKLLSQNVSQCLCLQTNLTSTQKPTALPFPDGTDIQISLLHLIFSYIQLDLCFGLKSAPRPLNKSHPLKSGTYI